MKFNPATLFDGNGVSITPQTLTASADGSAVDCFGHEYATVVHIFGTVSASNTATIQIQSSSDDSTSTDYADVVGAVYTCTGSEDNSVKLGSIRLNGKERYLRAVYTETATGQSTVLAVAILPTHSQDVPRDDATAFAYDVL
jgi:hypothetical protein